MSDEGGEIPKTAPNPRRRRRRKPKPKAIIVGDVKLADGSVVSTEESRANPNPKPKPKPRAKQPPKPKQAVKPKPKPKPRRSNAHTPKRRVPQAKSLFSERMLLTIDGEKEFILTEVEEKDQQGKKFISLEEVDGNKWSLTYSKGLLDDGLLDKLRIIRELYFSKDNG